MVVMVRLEKKLPAGASEPRMVAEGRQLALLSLVFWLIAITAGRFIAYTAQYALYPPT